MSNNLVPVIISTCIHVQLGLELELAHISNRQTNKNKVFVFQDSTKNGNWSIIGVDCLIFQEINELTFQH